MKLLDAFKELIDHFGAYLETRVELIKLRIIDKTSGLIAWILAGIILLFTLCCMMLFLSFAAANAIGEAVGKLWLGYLLVAAGYALVGLIAWMGRERFFKRPLVNAIITQLNKDDKSKTHEEANESGETREKD